MAKEKNKTIKIAFAIHRWRYVCVFEIQQVGIIQRVDKYYKSILITQF